MCSVFDVALSLRDFSVSPVSLPVAAVVWQFAIVFLAFLTLVRKRRKPVVEVCGGRALGAEWWTAVATPKVRR